MSQIIIKNQKFMKKHITIFVMITSVLCFSQVELEQSEIHTSDIEYQFLTEKYNSKNNSLLLEGYHLHPLHNLSYKQLEYDFQFFVHDSTNNVKAILIKITNRKKNSEKLKHLCLPINNDLLFNRFAEEYEKLGFNKGDFLDEMISQSIESYIIQFYNEKKKDIKTTNTEYDFLSANYNSNDNPKMMEGYELNPFFEVLIEEKYRYNYKLFVETKTTNVKAILIENIKEKTNENKMRYLFLPFNNNELYTKYRKDEIKKLGVNMWFYFRVSKLALYSRVIDNLYNVKKF